MKTPTSCSDPVTEGILIKSLCNANNSGDLLSPNWKLRPKGSLKLTSNALMKEAWKSSSPTINEHFMVEIMNDDFN
jgi:hypothetical protein